MNIKHFSNFVIQPTLAYVGDGLPGFDSESAVELLLGTVAHESRFSFLDQVTGPHDKTLGPAYGLYQIEPATLHDIIDNYLSLPKNYSLRERVLSLLGRWPSREIQLVTNLAFATAIARLVYWRSKTPLAKAGDIAGHARVWKQVYNTNLGKGREESFIEAYQRYIAPHLK